MGDVPSIQIHGKYHLLKPFFIENYSHKIKSLRILKPECNFPFFLALCFLRPLLASVLISPLKKT